MPLTHDRKCAFGNKSKIMITKARSVHESLVAYDSSCCQMTRACLNRIKFQSSTTLLYNKIAHSDEYSRYEMEHVDLYRTYRLEYPQRKNQRFRV